MNKQENEWEKNLYLLSMNASGAANISIKVNQQ